LAVDTLFLGGAALPPTLQQRLARVWGARVIELYGSTETMLLGTSLLARTLHLETDLAYCELIPVGPGGEAQLVVTTLGLEGSPLVRFDTGDIVRRGPPCGCGDPRPGLVVLGREADAIDLAGRRLFPYDVIDAGSAAADALDSAVFFIVVLDERLLVRVEAGAQGRGDPQPGRGGAPAGGARRGRAGTGGNAPRRRGALAEPTCLQTGPRRRLAALRAAASSPSARAWLNGRGRRGRRLGAGSCTRSGRPRAAAARAAHELAPVSSDR